jgi:hypothetical protein
MSTYQFHPHDSYRVKEIQFMLKSAEQVAENEYEFVRKDRKVVRIHVTRHNGELPPPSLKDDLNEAFTWPKCSSCGKYWDPKQHTPNCPNCGSAAWTYLRYLTQLLDPEAEARWAQMQREERERLEAEAREKEFWAEKFFWFGLGMFVVLCFIRGSYGFAADIFGWAKW